MFLIKSWRHDKKKGYIYRGWRTGVGWVWRAILLGSILSKLFQWWKEGVKKSVTLSSLSSTAIRDIICHCPSWESAQKTCPQICQPSLLQIPMKEGIIDRKVDCVVRLLGSPQAFYESFSLKNLQGFFLSRSFKSHCSNRGYGTSKSCWYERAVRANSYNPEGSLPHPSPSWTCMLLSICSLVYLYLQHHFPSGDQVSQLCEKWHDHSTFFLIFKGNYFSCVLFLYILTWHPLFHPSTVFLGIWVISGINHQLRITEQTHIYTCTCARAHTHTHICCFTIANSSLSCIMCLLPHFANYVVSSATCLLKTLWDGSVLIGFLCEITPIIDMIQNWKRT